MTDPSSTSSTTALSPHPAGRTGGRLAGGLVALGSALYLSSLFLPVGSGFYEALGDGDTARAQQLLEESATEWDISQGLAAVGIVVAAVGLWVLGRDIAAVAVQGRTRRWAGIAGWLGLLSGAGAIGSIYQIAASPADLAVTDLPPAPVVVAGLLTMVGMLGAFIGFGLDLVWMHHLKVFGWILLVVGILTLPTHAIMGPPASYLLLLVAGIVLAAAPVRDNSAAA